MTATLGLEGQGINTTNRTNTTTHNRSKKLSKTAQNEEKNNDSTQSSEQPAQKEAPRHSIKPARLERARHKYRRQGGRQAAAGSESKNDDYEPTMLKPRSRRKTTLLRERRSLSKGQRGRTLERKKEERRGSHVSRGPQRMSQDPQTSLPASLNEEKTFHSEQPLPFLGRKQAIQPRPRRVIKSTTDPVVIASSSTVAPQPEPQVLGEEVTLDLGSNRWAESKVINGVRLTVAKRTI